MPNYKKAELLPKIYFHLLFKGYIEVINNNKQSEELVTFELPFKDLYYERYDSRETLIPIINKINAKADEIGCSFVAPLNVLKYSIKPEILSEYINSYLDKIINADKLILPLAEEQDCHDCWQVHPYKKQLADFKDILNDNFNEYSDDLHFSFPMLDKYGGSGTSTHKRYCIDELLLILQREKFIDNIEVKEGKDYSDPDYPRERSHKPIYILTKAKKIYYPNGFWHDTIDRTIGYKDNEKVFDLFYKNGNPIKKTNLLLILFSSEKPLTEDEIIEELAKKNIKIEKSQLAGLKNDALSLIKNIDPEIEFKSNREKKDDVYYYALTSRGKTN